MIEMMRWTIYYRQRELTFVLHRPIEVAAESGLLIQRYAKNLTAAILPKAVAKLELRKMAARNPKRTLELSTNRRTIHEHNSRTSKTVF